MSDITYAYCIENLRYIHKIIGIDALIKEAMFIDHLSKYSKINSVNVDPICLDPVRGDTVRVDTVRVDTVRVDTVTTADSDLDVDPNISETTTETIAEIVPENKNIVINPQKYVRTVLSDEFKCECITNNGQRCTLKKSKDSKYCSRHKVKMS